MNGWGEGPTIVEPNEDNRYKNLIIIKYLDSNNKTEIKKVVNKYCYYNAISINYIDPQSNKKLDRDMID